MNRQENSIYMSVKIITQECCTCGVPFTLSVALDKHLQESGDAFYCPVGHRQYYSEAPMKVLKDEHAKVVQDLWKKIDELKRELKKVKALLKDAGIADEEKPVSEEPGGGFQVKERKTACPVCKLGYINIERHIRKQHPGYEQGEEMPETLIELT